MLLTAYVILQNIEDGFLFNSSDVNGKGIKFWYNLPLAVSSLVSDSKYSSNSVPVEVSRNFQKMTVK